MNSNRVYFIGAGPGDPSLITVKGLNILNRCGAVFTVPPYEVTFSVYLEGKDLFIPFAYDFDSLVEKVRTLLTKTEVAFLIPGDLAFFSPFEALIDTLSSQAEVIPGVGILNAASARLKKSLNHADNCTRTLVVSPKMLRDYPEGPSLRQLASPGVTLVIYMNDLPAGKLSEQLREGYKTNVPVAVFHRLGLPGEVVLTGALDDLACAKGAWSFLENDPKNDPTSLTLIVTGDSLGAVPNGHWWDKKREQSWRAKYPDC